MSGLLLLGGCEGDNLFEGTSGATKPSITLEAPPEVLGGDTLSIRVDARAPRGLELIELHLTGPIFKDTTYLVPEGASAAAPVFHLRMPELFVDPVLVVTANVRDMAGVSSAATDTVRAIQRIQ
jgi:hypothetical protein